MESDVFWVGIDWATEAHEVCVLRSDGSVLKQTSVKHDGAALRALCDELVKLAGGDSSRVSVAIEVPRGAVVETLIERGFAVFSINPKQLDRFRDRHNVAGAKDDRRDAFVLGDSLRTDTSRYRRIRLDDPLVIRIREHSRIHDDLAEERNALGNRLRDQLLRYFPQVLELGDVYRSKWLWALLEQASTPAKAAKLREAPIRLLLKTHRTRSVDSVRVRETLRREPVTVAPGVVEAASAHVALLIARLRVVDEQDTAVSRRLEELLKELATADAGKAEHRDAAILHSLPGVGTIVCATMLAEAAQILAERDYKMLRALCGTAPVTKQSGKSKSVTMRYACNSRLRHAAHHWARGAVQNDPRSRAHYDALRQRGKSQGHSYRAVADGLLRLLIGALRCGRLFDAERWRPVPAAA